jgi:transcriptional regulator with XRE-family HTH domain
MNTVKASKAPKDPEMVRIGRTLFTLRERYGYTQKELADAVEISRAYISLIESGAKPLQDRLLAKVADALEITPLAIKRFDHEAELAFAA